MPDVPPFPYQNACVVLDSNVLFAKDEREIISPRLGAMLECFKKYPNVEFFIPRMVVREHFFHKQLLLEEGIRRIEGGAQILAKLTGFKSSSLPSPLKLKWSMYRLFLAWLRDNKVKLVRIPIKEINWAGLITASVQRLAPFSPFNPDKREEKGFRDAIILETLVSFNVTAKPRTVVFICNDGLLRETAIDRIEGLLPFRDIADYLSRLELELNHYTQELAEVLLGKLQDVFCGSKSFNNVYKYNDIELWIRRNFEARLSSLPDPQPPGTQLPLTLGGYEYIAHDIIEIGTVKINDIDLSSWKVSASNEVTFRRPFRGKELSIVTWIRIFTANVKWIAHLYPGGADIHTTELIGIEEALLGNAFATTEDYIAFGLPVPVFEAKDIWRDFPKIDPYGS